MKGKESEIIFTFSWTLLVIIQLIIFKIVKDSASISQYNLLVIISSKYYYRLNIIFIFLWAEY